MIVKDRIHRDQLEMFGIEEVVPTGRRKEIIERVFADAKEKHAMRYTPYRDFFSSNELG